MQKTTQSNKITIYEGLDFSLVLEYNSETVILHLGEIHKFSPSVLRKMKELETQLYPFLVTVGHTRVFAAIHKSNFITKKLATRFGFNYVGSEKGFDIFVYGDN